MTQPPEVQALIPTLGSVPMAMMITDCYGVACWANAQSAQLSGFSVAEIVGQNAAMLVSDGEEATHRLIGMVQEVVESGEPWSGESVRRRKSGESGEIELTITPIRNETDRPTHLLWTERDARGQRPAKGPLADLDPRFRQIADAAPVLIWTSGTDTLCNYFNKPWLDFTGRTLEQELGNGWAEGVHPDDFQHCLRTYLTSFENKTTFTMEYRLRRTDGEYRWLLDTGVPRYSSSGRFEGFIGSCVDITERKLAEEVLQQEQDQRYQILFDRAHDGIFIMSLDGKLETVNQSFADMHGYSVDEMRGIRLKDLAAPDTAQQVPGRLRRLLDGEALTFEVEHYHKDGHVFPLEVSASLSKVGGAAFIQCFLQDITERKHAARQLQEAQSLFQVAMDSCQVGIAIADVPSGSLRYVNNAGLMIRGADRQAVVDGVGIDRYVASWQMLDFDGTPLKAEEVPLARAVLFGETCSREFIIRRSDREDRTVLANAAPVRDSHGNVVAGIVAFLDRTDQRKAEFQLRESEERLRRAVLQAPFPIILHAEDGEVLMISDTWTEITGYSHTDVPTIADWTELAYGERKHLVQADIDRLYGLINKLHEGEFEIRTKCGKKRTWEFASAPLGKHPDGRRLAMSMAVDVTERKRLEASLLQAQKLESVGRLAGGVAHDFNNLLTVINGYSQLLLDDRRLDETIRRTLTEILRAGERAAGLTAQLLAYSRKQVLQSRRLDLNNVVQEMRSMLQRLLGEDVEVRVALKASAGIVQADPHQLDQVVMNLAVNAKDAMPGGGKLMIETANVELDENYVQTHPGAPLGRCVMLAVSDTGVGMDKETQRNIFEPFFTTKGMGKGTGLGLSTVQGIVAQSGGYIDVYSEPGHGTTFKIYLPALTELAADTGQVAATPVVRGHETVLVVEDQHGVLQYAVAALSAYGYRVLKAGNRSEAVQAFEQERGCIDLVLTDVIMPNGSGRELADELERRQPGIKVLFMSGYTDEAIAHHGVLEEGAEFIQKPFSPQQLATKVRQVLG